VAPQNNHLPIASEPRSSTDTIVPAEPAARELSWEQAVSKLRQSRAQLRELRNKGTVRVQRLIGRATTLLPPTPFGALCGIFDTLPLNVENVLLGYAQGIYALEINGTVRWHCPPERFVLYLGELRISAAMRRELKLANYTMTFDRAPREVLEQCAKQGTWLSERLLEIYMELFELGAMHTIEAWQGGTLVGGSFGVSVGTVWTSESMFHSAPHAGKVLFVTAAQHLRERGFELMDGHQYTDHFARFGARDVPITEYRAALARGLAAPARFYPDRARPPRGQSTDAPLNVAPGSTSPGNPSASRSTTTGKQRQKGPHGGSDPGVS